MSALEQSHYLSVLSATPPERIKPFVEDLLESMGEVEVLENRTGLVMVPGRDTAKGALFHLGEVLVAEAKVRACGAVGYGACIGRDLEQAMAIAVLDAALQGGFETERIARFVAEQATAQEQADEDLLRQVEATRVEMETF